MSKQQWAVDGELLDVSVERQGTGYVATVGDQSLTLDTLGDGLFTLVIDGRRRVVAVVRDKDKFLVDIDAMIFEVAEPSSSSGAAIDDVHGAKDKIFAPMPGKIVKLLVAVGDDVSEKQPMVIVEAMKMENQVTAKAKGKVKAVNFAA